MAENPTVTPRMHPRGVDLGRFRPETNREKTASLGVMSLWSRYLGTFRSDWVSGWMEVAGERCLGEMWLDWLDWLLWLLRHDYSLVHFL